MTRIMNAWYSPEQSRALGDFKIYKSPKGNNIAATEISETTKVGIFPDAVFVGQVDGNGPIETIVVDQERKDLINRLDDLAMDDDTDEMFIILEIQLGIAVGAISLSNDELRRIIEHGIH